MVEGIAFWGGEAFEKGGGECLWNPFLGADEGFECLINDLDRIVRVRRKYSSLAPKAGDVHINNVQCATILQNQLLSARRRRGLDTLFLRDCMLQTTISKSHPQ